MFYVCKPRVVALALISFALMFSSVQGISVANAATPPITRALPVGSNLYSISCDGGVPNGQLGGFVTASRVPTGAQTRIGSGTTDANSSYCVFGLAYNEVTQKGYWVSPKVIGGVTKQHLFSIDISTGVSTYIAEIRADQSGRAWAETGGNLTVMYGITFRAGKMIAMWRGESTPVWVGEVEINAVNAADNGKIYSAVQLNDIDPSYDVGDLSREWPWNFAYNSVDEKFYTAGYLPRTGRTGRTLYEINVATGLTTDKGQSGNTNALFWGMQFDSNGVIWGGDYRLNSATVTGWTTAGDLQQTATFSTFSPLTRHDINGVFIVSTLSTSPSAPTLNTVTGGDRSISVAFTAGANGGASITDYEYSLNGGTYISAATTTSPFTITSGISGRTTYSVTLKARNSVGLGSASGSLSATTTDSSADASEAAAAAAEAARVAAVEAARVAAVNAAVAAAAAKRAAEQKEMSELLAVLPSIAGLALNIGELTNSLLTKQKCVNGKKTKSVSYGSKCPKGFVKRK